MKIQYTRNHCMKLWGRRTREIDIKITKITLKNDIPIFQKLHRLSYLEKKEVDKQLKIGLNDSIIKSCSSEYIISIVLIKMKIVILKSDCRKWIKKIIKSISVIAIWVLIKRR